MPNVLPTRELLSTHANEPAAAPGALMAEDERYDTYRFDFLAFFFFGTFAPARRASDRPMAIACFLLLTFLPDLPDLRVPALRSCIAFPTFFDAFLPYLAMTLLHCSSFLRTLTIRSARDARKQRGSY